MPAFSDFDLDFRHGKAGEDSVAKLLNDPTVEVKSDRIWWRSGNLFIEVACWSTAQNAMVPSGIAKTKADYWAFHLEGMVFLVETDVIKQTIKRKGVLLENKTPPNPSKGYIIKVEDILDEKRAQAKRNKA